MEGFSIFGSKDRRCGVLRSSGSEDRRTLPHLRSSKPQDRRNPSIYDLRSATSKIEGPLPIFVHRLRRSKKPPTIYDLRSRRLGRRSPSALWRQDGTPTKRCAQKKTDPRAPRHQRQLSMGRFAQEKTGSFAPQGTVDNCSKRFFKSTNKRNLIQTDGGTKRLVHSQFIRGTMISFQAAD